MPRVPQSQLPARTLKEIAEALRLQVDRMIATEHMSVLDATRLSLALTRLIESDRKRKKYEASKPDDDASDTELDQLRFAQARDDLYARIATYKRSTAEKQ